VREFDTDSLPNGLFGFDKYSVVKLVDSLRTRFLELWEERDGCEERIKDLELELHRSREGQRWVGETLLVAQRQAQAIRQEAREEADSLMKSARKRAKEIEALSEHAASVKARELLHTAERERSALLDEASKARAFVEQTHEQLSEFLLAAVKWYEQTKLVGDEDSQPERESDAARPPEKLFPADPVGATEGPSATERLEVKPREAKRFLQSVPEGPGGLETSSRARVAENS
jgi:cell division septum initiation protein DivIVA